MNLQAAEEMRKITDDQQKENIKKAIENGAVIPCSSGVVIGENVKIGQNTLILSGTVLLGNTVVGENCIIGPNTLLFNVSVGDGTHLNSVQGFEAEIGSSCDIGPFVHIRPNSVIKDKAHLGNFVEAKNSVIGEGTKVSHLTYIGDSDVGKNVNFGCGCVTVNYTGKEKFRTTVGDNCFIGCNTNLIAPVKIGDFGYTAAGSTITEDVPENSLGIARARQVNKENWVLRKKPYKGMD